mmetsp:Transcript_45295/g.98093  ORF Transcript_45295/g.98093 Transcript_45295/m.98093 type:complete len:147 (+) Transcript_45295:104-544(+)
MVLFRSSDSEHSPSSDNAIPRSDSDARSNMVAAEALTALSGAVDPAITGLRRKADVAMPGPPNKRTTSAFKELPRPAAESVVRPAARRAMGNAQPLHVPLPLHLLVAAASVALSRCELSEGLDALSVYGQCGLCSQTHRIIPHTTS